ncbi:uncharacterized protein LOC124118398 [Haliotis rufescens]|uniref:uncharacterized protein LOC124118398 n=1 Tax=Haliotis rufescens TaxID=6454 RepID=UPI00201EFC05|nr:uncharacterized protein LOC124118398 [Haliotis rufescens]
MATCNTVVLLLCLLINVDQVLTSDYVFNDQQTPAFKDYEMFQDIFPLTVGNFTDLVINRPDPWIVIFHKGMLERGWKSLAVSLRGVVWVGMVDLNNNKQLLQQIGYSADNDSDARVYKYGTQKTKLKSWRRVSDPNTARSTAVSSIPDTTLQLTSDDLEDFLIDSFMSKPSRFPAVFITEERESSAMMKALSLRFQKYFNFGKIAQPSSAGLRGLGMERFSKDIPTLLVLMANGENMESPQFNAIPFDKKAMGELNYPNILAFLFSVNREFRHLMPGENGSDRRETVEMDDIVKIESLRFDVKGLHHSTESKKVLYEEVSELHMEETIQKRLPDEL